MDWYSRSGIFNAAIVSFFEGQNVTLLTGNVTNHDFVVFFLNEKSEYNILSAKMFPIKFVIE